MATKAFTIYRSSAGSGKTRTLAKEYLKLALRHRSDSFKHLLAVTFTNKATQEMKDRILTYLNKFANNIQDDLATELKKELGLDHQTFVQYAQDAQSSILHAYSQFSISTIDAFFQKVIRSFTREAGLVGDYRLEVEQDEVMEQVIDNLIDELGSNAELTQWVVDFASENLENERAWDVRQSLIEFSREIFREEFKSIEDEVTGKTAEPGFFRGLMDGLKKTRKEYLHKTQTQAFEAVSMLRKHGLTESDFKYKGNGSVFTFFEGVATAQSIADIEKRAQGARVNGEFRVSRNWPDKMSRQRALIEKLADDGLLDVMNTVVEVAKKDVVQALSAEAALKNLYAFGLIADISRKLKDYKEENNVMLLADAPKFLHGVIRDSDTPFIYEKVGSFYRHYLIDEFQDTSGLQWKNFLPLLQNSLDQGFKNLVVGDVKQAIYRWRGGDLTLLQEHVEKSIGADRIELKGLGTNYRSATAVVDFNNELFKTASAIVASETGDALPVQAYADVEQKKTKATTGYVSVQFVHEDEEVTWKANALELVPAYLEELQRKGVPLRDIAVLVRKNEDGQQIASHLLQYKNSDRALEGFKYDVVSNELLRVDGASTVNLLIAALKYLLNPDDSISRAQLSYEFSKLHHPDKSLNEVFTVANQAIFEDNLPPGFAREKTMLRKLPLVELLETLIEVFKLGEVKGEFVYLQAFEDLLLEFNNRERNDLGAFLEWWELNKTKKSIKVSEDVDAVQIYTIHKSKGLQFKYVIIPYCFWTMDHERFKSPNLWVKSDQQPFDSVGYLPVKYTSSLEKTYFSEFYTKEHSQALLDNLNLLYVALTRAEHGLMVIAPSPDVRNAKGSVAGLLYQAIQQNQTLSPSWDLVKQQFIAGSLGENATPGQEEPTPSVSLSRYPSYRWRDKLVIRHDGAAYFDELEKERKEKAKYGIYIHELLSRIHYADELDKVFDQLVSAGFITPGEKDEVYTQISELLVHPVISSWFTREWEVMTEAPIILPGGTENRIDRLMIRGGKALIVDFKTGEPAKHDQRQVTEYIEILRKMNFVDVEGFILYVRSGEVVSVNTSKVRKVKARDENQLGIPGLM